MEREAEEGEAAHARQGRRSLRLRGHAAAEGFAAGNERELGDTPRRFRHSRAHRLVREHRRIRPLGAAFHIRELVAQARDAALGKTGGNLRHERMRHAGPGAMGEHVTGARAGRNHKEAGDALRVLEFDGQWLGATGCHVGPIDVEART
jgi:hypothetical protein